MYGTGTGTLTKDLRVLSFGSMPFVRARDGHHLYVRVAGRGQPCLLLHGFASDSTSWLPFVAPLTRRYRFYMLDLRGFGQSIAAPLRHACPLTTYAEDLEDVLDALALGPLPLAGISMGAFTAVQSFKLFGGKRYTRYLHIDQGPVIRNGAGWSHGLLGAKQAEFFARIERLVARLDAMPELPAFDALPPDIRTELGLIFAEFAAAAFGSRLARTLVRRLARRESALRRLMPAEALRTYLQIMRAYLEQNYDMRDALREIRVPMTVLIGADSRMYPAAGQRSIGTLVPHAKVLELPGTGHVVPLEAPLRFVSELKAFLEAS